MHVDPINPPTRVTAARRGPSRAQVVSVHADGTVDVRLSLSRGGKSRVPVITGLTLAARDLVLLELVDGDPNVPVITAKLPAKAFG